MLADKRWCGDAMLQWPIIVSMQYNWAYNESFFQYELLAGVGEVVNVWCTCMFYYKERTYTFSHLLPILKGIITFMSKCLVSYEETAQEMFYINVLLKISLYQFYWHAHFVVIYPGQ